MAELFCVVLEEPDAQIEETLKTQFESSIDSFKLSDTSFLVASSAGAHELSTQLGLYRREDESDAEAENRTAVVVLKLNGTYSGFHRRSLWDWLKRFKDHL